MDKQLVTLRAVSTSNSSMHCYIHPVRICRTYQEVLPAKTASHDESCRKQAQQQQLGIGDLQGGQTESGAASSQPVVWQAQVDSY